MRVKAKFPKKMRNEFVVRSTSITFVLLILMLSVVSDNVPSHDSALRQRHLEEPPREECLVRGLEGASVEFNASCVFDPPASSTVYRWDFDANGDWDTAWGPYERSNHTWGDDFSGDVHVARGETREEVDIKLEAPLLSGGQISWTQWLAQAFVPTKTLLTKVAVCVSINWGWPSDLHAWIRETLDPSGKNLSHGSIPYTQVPRDWAITPSQWPIIDMDDVVLEANKTYYLMLNMLTSSPGVYWAHGIGDVRPDWPLYGGNFQYGWGKDPDDDLGIRTYTEDVVTISEGQIKVDVENANPVLAVSKNTSDSIKENSRVVLVAQAIDPGSDDLIFTWRWDHGPTDTRTFYNDGFGPDPPNSPGGIFPFTATDSSIHTYGDDCPCNITLSVTDDDGGTATFTTTVDVLNVAPSFVGNMEAYAHASLVLRVAGEKWHDVFAYLNEGWNETLLTRIVRQPGKPQEASFEIGIDATRNSSLRIAYTPDDDKVNGQPNGATPAWLNITFDSGPPVSMHHTFNVKHPDAWNWTVGLNSMLAGREITFTATATDPGSDDLTFTWDWGDGSPATAATYYNDGIGPDPYPSPGGAFPFTATDTQTHTFAVAGTYDVRLTVGDDDGGVDVVTVIVIIL